MKADIKKKGFYKKLSILVFAFFTIFFASLLFFKTCDLIDFKIYKFFYSIKPSVGNEDFLIIKKNVNSTSEEFTETLKFIEEFKINELIIELNPLEENKKDFSSFLNCQIIDFENVVLLKDLKKSFEQFQLRTSYFFDYNEIEGWLKKSLTERNVLICDSLSGLEEVYIKSYFSSNLWIYFFSVSVILLLVFVLCIRKLDIKRQVTASIIYFFIYIFLNASLYFFLNLFSFSIILFFLNFSVLFFTVLIRYCSVKGKHNYYFSTYSSLFSDENVEKIMEEPSLLNLEGRDTFSTFLTSRISDFALFCSKVSSSEKLCRLMKEYFTKISEEICKNNGCLSTFADDSVRAVFGAPLSIREHAYSALFSALEIKKIEADFNKRHLISGDIPFDIKTTFAINSSNFCTGNFGSERKINYTVFGPETRFSENLNKLCNLYGISIVCTEESWNLIDYGLHKSEVCARKIDKVSFYSNEKAVQIYDIIGFFKDLTSQQKDEVILFNTAMELYEKHSFEEAYDKFLLANQMIPEDKAALIYAERCKKYMQK